MKFSLFSIAGILIIGAAYYAGTKNFLAPVTNLVKKAA